MLTDSYSKILESFVTAVGLWDPTVQIEHENTEGGLTAPFMRVVFLPVDNQQVQLGTSGKNRYDAILRVESFISGNTGMGDATAMLDRVKNEIFPRGTRLVTAGGNTIIFGTPVPLPGRKDSQGIYRLGFDFRWFVLH